MSGRSDLEWSRHRLEPWGKRSTNPNLPLWLRLASLAYARHQPNGHANFRRGELARLFGHVDHGTGEVIPLTRQRMHEAVQQAIGYGFLAEGSIPMCLVVSLDDVRIGKEDATPAPCKVHSRRRR